MTQETVTREDVLAQLYQMALERAQARSVEFDCTVHVCASIQKGDPPQIIGFYTDDWYDGSTVATFTSGHRHD